MKTQKGFTLIELLVVISIIGLLASVVLVSLQSARKKARTAKRVSDMRQIQTALELYYNDNGSYPNPSPSGNWRSECSAWGGYTSDQVITGLVPTYLQKFPSDPSMDKANSTSCYLYATNGADYKLLDHNIVEYSSAEYLAQSGFVDPARDSGADCSKVDGGIPWSWAVYTPGVICW